MCPLDAYWGVDRAYGRFEGPEWYRAHSMAEPRPSAAGAALGEPNSLASGRESLQEKHQG